MVDVTPEPIIRKAMCFMATKPLFAASAIGIFERLPKGLAAARKLAQDRPL